MPTLQPDLAIIIVNWNTRQILLDCLALLPSATSSLTVEVWVVDNGSSDGSVAAVHEQYPEVRIIANQTNLGFAAANNQAIRASSSRHVLLLNSDTLPSPGSLTKLVHFLDMNPPVGIVGPLLRNADGSVQLSYASFPTLTSELSGRNWRVQQPYQAAGGTVAYNVDWVGGACLAVRRSALHSFGLLDERYFMYTEETDWCYRAQKAGWQVCYLPDTEVVHLGGQSSRMANVRMKIELYRSKLRFFDKHYGRKHAHLLRASLFSIFLAKAVAGALLAILPSRRQIGRMMSRESSLLLAALDQQLRQPLEPEVVR